MGGGDLHEPQPLVAPTLCSGFFVFLPLPAAMPAPPHAPGSRGGTPGPGSRGGTPGLWPGRHGFGSGFGSGGRTPPGPDRRQRHEQPWPHVDNEVPPSVVPPSVGAVRSPGAAFAPKAKPKLDKGGLLFRDKGGTILVPVYADEIRYLHRDSQGAIVVPDVFDDPVRVRSPASAPRLRLHGSGSTASASRPRTYYDCEQAAAEFRDFPPETAARQHRKRHAESPARHRFAGSRRRVNDAADARPRLRRLRAFIYDREGFSDDAGAVADEGATGFGSCAPIAEYGCVEPDSAGETRFGFGSLASSPVPPADTRTLTDSAKPGAEQPQAETS